MKKFVIATMLLLIMPAWAIDLPIDGVFGLDDDDCKAAKAQDEGGYVGLSKGSIGFGGMGGCDVVAVQKHGANRYTITGKCFDLDGHKKRRKLALTIVSDSEIEFDDSTYKRCPK